MDRGNMPPGSAGVPSIRRGYYRPQGGGLTIPLGNREERPSSESLTKGEGNEAGLGREGKGPLGCQFPIFDYS